MVSMVPYTPHVPAFSGLLARGLSGREASDATPSTVRRGERGARGAAFPLGSQRKPATGVVARDGAIVAGAIGWATGKAVGCCATPPTPAAGARASRDTERANLEGSACT